jgi:hypothetical protein
MSSFETLYRPAALKIERGKCHINDVDERIQSFLSKRPFVLVIVRDEYAGKITFEIEAQQPMPEAFSLVLGEAMF